ncbi:MAG: hypothetical protein PHS60_02835 [Zavarzinia sp.]|nr:hypothetical protein [Zavarzinia sp.]
MPDKEFAVRTVARGASLREAGQEPRLDQLRFAGQMALWSLRQGLGLLRGDITARELMVEAFAVTGVERALVPLEMFMRILAAGAHRPLELRAPRSALLGHDEALLLRALAACQAGERALARGLLENMVTAAAARVGTLALDDMAAVFTLRGLRLADTTCGRLSALEPVFARAAFAGAGLSRLH